MVLILAICITAVVIAVLICATVHDCVHFKYRDTAVIKTEQEQTDLQAQLDEEKEKNKLPTMEDMILVAQQLIGGDDDED